MMMGALVACGPSDEKMAEVTQALSVMTGAGESARETYLDITDSSMKARLDELQEKENEIKTTEWSKLNDKKIDEILPSIAEITEEYQSIGGQLNEILSAETATKEEKAKHNFQQVFFVNKTGMNLTEIKLHDLTQDTWSDNYLGEGVVLEAGYTLMGPALDVYTDSSRWEFVIKSEADTEYTLSCESLFPVDTKGMSITFTYDSKTGEGSAAFGSYTAEPQETEAEASGDASKEATEGASGEDINSASEAASTDDSGEATSN